MKPKKSLIFLIPICIFLTLITSALARCMISGKVVDADTKKPIVGAAIYISWWKMSGPPGLASNVKVEVAECLTDDKGFFKIPKYSTLFKDYLMAVYKKGYVCWNNEDIFPTYEKRKDFKLKNGMVIKLERFKEEYSKERHANFTIGSSPQRKSPGLFDDAIKSERDFLAEIAKKQWENKRGK